MTPSVLKQHAHEERLPSPRDSQMSHTLAGHEVDHLDHPDHPHGDPVPSPDSASHSSHDRSRSPHNRKQGFWRSLLNTIAPDVSFVLENAGSVARDHLANERTWLAYVRTSLAIAGTGVALVQLFAIATSEEDEQLADDNRPSLRRFARPLGATTVLIGFSILCIGVYRYFTIQKAMTQGKFPVARNTVIIISAVLAALAAVIFGVLIALPTVPDI